MGCRPTKLKYVGYIADGFDRHPHPKLRNYVLVRKRKERQEGTEGTEGTDFKDRETFIKQHCTMVKFLVDGKIYNMPVLNIDD